MHCFCVHHLLAFFIWWHMQKRMNIMFSFVLAIRGKIQFGANGLNLYYDLKSAHIIHPSFISKTKVDFNRIIVEQITYAGRIYWLKDLECPTARFSSTPKKTGPGVWLMMHCIWLQKCYAARPVCLITPYKQMNKQTNNQPHRSSAGCEVWQLMKTPFRTIWKVKTDNTLKSAKRKQRRSVSIFIARTQTFRSVCLMPAALTHPPAAGPSPACGHTVHCTELSCAPDNLHKAKF